MARAERIVVVLLLDCAGGVHDGPHTAQMVRDVVVHRIGVVPRLADAPAAEGDALQRVGVVGPPGVDEGAHIVLPAAGGGVCGCLRPVGEVCVVGFHGGSGLDLCRQVNQIVRRLQVVGGVGGDVAVDIVGIAVPAVACIGESEAAEGAGVVIAVDLGDVARAAVGDGLLGEGVGGGPVVVELPGGEAVGLVVGEGVGLGVLSILCPGPGGDVAGVAGGGARLDRGVVAQGHREDVGGVVAAPLDCHARGEPTLDVECVGGGDGVGA